jgi:phosphatidate cytidylyltransferase
MGGAATSSLWPRVATSVILIPSALAAVYAGGWVLALWAGAAGVAMAREWTRIVHHETQLGWRFALHGLAIAGSQFLLVVGQPNWAVAVVLFAAFVGSLIARKNEERSVWLIAGILFVAMPCLAFANLRMLSPYGFETVIWLLCVVWATDSVAFMAGSKFGGPKLAPLISPKKTWAGAIAGLVAGVLAGVLLAKFAGQELSLAFAGASAVLSVMTQCGDLAESFLKRSFGVKDASDLIPGHGGALDRLDGMIFATSGLALFVLFAGYSPVVWALS